MEKYQQRRDYLKENIHFHLSSFGFGVYCDYAICSRMDGSEKAPVIDMECIKKLKNGDKLFFNACSAQHMNEQIVTYICHCLNECKLQLNLYIMYEPVFPWRYIEMLLPFSINIFLMNNEYDHPKIHHMPIGIRDGEEVRLAHKHFSQKTLFIEGNTPREKKYLCMICYSPNDERNKCTAAIGDKPFVLNLNTETFAKQPSIHCGKIPVWINYQKTHESWYIPSPPGAGVDCHRFYEAIYLDAIPIVKRTHGVFDKLYRAFPCLIVDDWTDITEDFLEKKKPEMIKKQQEFKEKYPNWITDVGSIHELLLKT